MKKNLWFMLIGLPLLGASCFHPGASLTNALAEKATEKILGQATGTNVDINGNAIQINDNGAALNFGNNSMPADFPSSIPLYKGATITSSFANGQDTNSGRNWTIMFTSTDAVASVNGFFSDALKKNGWTTTYNYNLDQSYGYTAKHGELSITVTISPSDDGKSNIFMSVEQKKNTNTNGE